jgi:hypothetical protein
MIGWLVILTDTGHIGKRARRCLRIQALRIPLGTHLDRGVDEHLDEVPVGEDLPSGPTICAEWRDQSYHDDEPGIKHQLRRFGNASDVLSSILRCETEILVQACAHVIAVENVGVHTECVQATLGGVGDRGLAGAGQSGEPHHPRPLVLQPGPSFAVDLVGMGDDIEGASQGVGHHAGCNSVCGHSVDEEESAGVAARGV